MKNRIIRNDKIDLQGSIFTQGILEKAYEMLSPWKNSNDLIYKNINIKTEIVKKGCLL